MERTSRQISKKRNGSGRKVITYLCPDFEGEEPMEGQNKGRYEVLSRYVRALPTT